MSQPTTVGLGFEIPTGEPVVIPIRNMVVCGQTQEAGKTTALEGLIKRSGMRAVTFVTKRGEGSFTGARRIPPYFRDGGGWEFVASILEASRGEKLKFERSWIIKAARGTATLADVHRNVRTALATAKGINEGVYTVLDAYLDVVVPVIARTTWAPALQLEPGVNAVDVTDLPMEMQHLVIKSSLDWVLEREKETIVVIPEAWKFVPEGRGTPVKLAAVALIRQGSGLKNYVWLDSQDIGGVDKEMLRSCPVWLLGVQRETNEVKRTLANIPDGTPKLRPADISTLELGQFYACWKTHAVKTYVQPAWRSPALAREVAMGAVGIYEVDDRPKEKKVTVTEREMESLRAENDRLTRENARLTERLTALETKFVGLTAPAKDRTDIVTDSFGQPLPKLKTMELRPAPSIGGSYKSKPDIMGKGAGERPMPFEGTFASEEDRYQATLTRLRDDAPALLKLLVDVPEIEVQQQRRVITADGSTTKGRVARLIAGQFLDDIKRFSDIRRELERTGSEVNNKTLSNVLAELVVDGFLTKEGTEGYQAVKGMKVNVVEA